MKIFSNFVNTSHLEYFTTKYSDLPITLFYDYPITDASQLKENPYNIFLTHEPNEIFGIHDWILNNSRFFDLVLTYNKKLLDNIPQSYNFYFNGAYSNDTSFYEENLKDKIFRVSYLCGNKNITEGHKLRQAIYPLEEEITLEKQWHYLLEDFDHSTNVRPGYTEYSKDLSHVPKYHSPEMWGKRFLYEETMFNVAIENVKVDGWFTEKIAQCFLTKTLPIYWGCGNIEEYGYDERGIIRFNTPEELKNILNNLTPEDYYNRLPYIEHNFKVSLTDNLLDSLSLILDNISFE